MRTSSNTRFICVLFAAMAITVAACHPLNSPRGVVDRFIDAHYVRADLKTAATFCTGLALDKVHQEMKLTEGQKIDAGTRQPSIFYHLEAENDLPDHIEYIFHATIDVPDGGSFERKWLIAARKDGDTWKVSNYGEY
ncbi:MAG TPA: hypothetical protein VMU16_04515 [Candidatus Binataceae bacterium]|nr:hypothetical protein [Candidatus Binataceae bacterium]